MNFKWTVSKKQGQSGIGFVFECKAIDANIPVSALVYCFPNLNQFGNNKIANVTIFWQGTKTEVTDVFFHWVLDDIGEIIKNDEINLFDGNSLPFDLMMTNQYFVKELPDVTYFTHGDYKVI